MEGSSNQRVPFYKPLKGRSVAIAVFWEGLFVMHGRQLDRRINLAILLKVCRFVPLGTCERWCMAHGACDRCQVPL